MENFLSKLDDDTFPNEVFFEGICNPEGKDKNYDGLYFKQEDLNKIQDTLPNTNILSEHDQSKKIGSVIGARVDEKKRLRVLGSLDTSTVEGVKLINQIRNGELKGLSLGTSHLILDLPNTQKVVGQKVTEVSVVKNPDFDSTLISYIQPMSKNKQLYYDLINEKLQKLKYKKTYEEMKTKSENRKMQQQQGQVPAQKPVIPTTNQQQGQQTPQNPQNPIVVPTTQPPVQEEKKEEPKPNEMEQQLAKEREEKEKYQKMVEDMKKREEESNLASQKNKQFNDELDHLKKDAAELDELEKLSKDPNKVQELASKLINKKRKRVQEKAENVKKFMAENYKKVGIAEDPEFMKHLDNASSFPLAASSFVTAMTVAHTASQLSLSEKEKEYQKLKQEKEDFQKKQEIENKRLMEEKAIAEKLAVENAKKLEELEKKMKHDEGVFKHQQQLSNQTLPPQSTPKTQPGPDPNPKTQNSNQKKSNLQPNPITSPDFSSVPFSIFNPGYNSVSGFKKSTDPMSKEFYDSLVQGKKQNSGIPRVPSTSSLTQVYASQKVQPFWRMVELPGEKFN